MKLTRLKEIIKIKSSIVREFLAELLGTFVFLSIGIGSVAHFVLYGNMVSISKNIAFSFGVSMGIIIAGNISGGHVNPAVSLAFLLTGQLRFIKFLFYVIAQCIAAFLSSVIVFLIYYDALSRYDGGFRLTTGVNATASIWATYPAANVSTVSAFFEELFGTFLFILLFLSITDKRNGSRSVAANGTLIGLSCLLVSVSFGINCGGAINPARDFIPRLFTAIAGYGASVFTANNYFFWIPIVAPLIGSALATFIYSIIIRNNWPDETMENIDIEFSRIKINQS